jgi:hypothetical protein
MCLKSRISPETLNKKTSSSFKSPKPSKKSTIRKIKTPSSRPHPISRNLANHVFLKEKSAPMVTFETASP